MKQSILVLGATGNVGSVLTQRLVEQGHHVKAASRSGKAIASATGVVFDYFDADTHASAFEGVDTAYIMLAAGYTQITDLLIPLVKLAASKNIKVVLQTALGVDADDAIPYRQVELALINSGTEYVILRPNWFADNFHTFWKAGIDYGVIQLPAANGASSFIDVRDIAECAASALTNNAFNGQAFNLTGPQAFSYEQAASLLADHIDKSIAYTHISDESFIDMLTGAGVSVHYASFIAQIFYPVREGWTAVTTDDVQALTGHAPRSLNQYINDNKHLLAA